VIVRKTADKDAQMTGKGMDKVFNIDFSCSIAAAYTGFRLYDCEVGNKVDVVFKDMVMPKFILPQVNLIIK
jgi:hypothetical protein